MLKLARNMREFSFGDLMEVYLEGNREKATEEWSDLPEGFALEMAEQDFHQFLRESFFAVPGAVYAIWEMDGKYVSALRLEPYRDGLLMEALETMPGQRRKGYGTALIHAVLDRIGGTKLYSHVHKSNEPSLNIHKKCGFKRIKEYAVYIDGSVNHRCCTFCHEG